VPFIGYTALRARGVSTSPSGRPLLFGDLFHPGVARATLGTASTGFVLAIAGILTTSTLLVAIGGVALSVTGLMATLNLAVGPIRVLRRRTPTEVPAVAPTTAVLR